jgi:hypothetical protein
VSDEPDAVMVRYGEALARSQGGDRDGARAQFDALWAEVGAHGDPLHRCAIAHAMADVQDELQDELVWDLRALAAAGELTDGRVAAAGVANPVAAFYPSLHLNIGDVYRRLGDVGRARDHLELGREALDALPDDGYGAMVRGGFDRLAARLDGTEP